MKYTYPKTEKLKSRKLIENIFAEGKSINKYPLRLAYSKLPVEAESAVKLGVSVSKKYFKKAVDRNYIKRLLREAYRLNKNLLIDDKQGYAFMLLYQSAVMPDFIQINEKTIQLFSKFAMMIKSAEGNN